MKDYSDLEREAYIRNDITVANLYAKVSQVDFNEYEIELLKDKVFELERSLLNQEVNRELEDDIEYWRKRAVKAEGELEEAKYILESLSK